jgi:hypothetical protein
VRGLLNLAKLEPLALRVMTV